MTFGLLYAFSENFVLPISHDEVVHGKGSVVGKMPGDEWQRFANARAFYGFMWGHPGKKLLFMGQEFGQTMEWNAAESLPWWLLDHWPHQGVQTLIRDLNRIYRETPALHARDCEPEGFRWIVVNDDSQSVLAFLRRGAQSDPPVAVVCNFTPEPRMNYRVGLALRGPLARGDQYRCVRLWRVEYGQFRRRPRRATTVARLSGFGNISCCRRLRPCISSSARRIAAPSPRENGGDSCRKHERRRKWGYPLPIPDTPWRMCSPGAAGAGFSNSPIDGRSLPSISAGNRASSTLRCRTR